MKSFARSLIGSSSRRFTPYYAHVVSGSHVMRSDFFDRIMKTCLGNEKIVVGLEIDPKLRSRPEIPPQPQRRVGRNVALPPDDLLHTITRDQKRLRKSTRRQIVLGQKIFSENFSGMNGSWPIVAHIFLPSVIVDNFNVKGVAVFPFETDAPLPIDANAVLPLAITLEGFKVVRRRDTQVIQRDRRIELGKPPLRSCDDIGRKPFWGSTCPDGNQPFVFRRSYHSITVFLKDTGVNVSYSMKIQKNGSAR